MNATSLDLSWFEAIADTESEAKALHNRHLASIKHKNAMAGYR